MPNPNGLRIATYRVSAEEGDPTEIAVSRAGGSTDANVQRWVGQFENPSAEKRTTIVEVSGTYAGNGMLPADRAVSRTAGRSSAPSRHRAASPASSRRSARVRAARSAVDAMIASLTRP